MSESNVYTAECILNKRTKNGHTEYFIKWRGYPNSENTWEPIENILDRGLLTAFEEKRKYVKRGRPKKQSASESTSNAVANLDDRENSRDIVNNGIVAASSTTQNSGSSTDSYATNSPIRGDESQSSRSKRLSTATPAGNTNKKCKLAIFNPVDPSLTSRDVANQEDDEDEEVVVYEPLITKQPIVVTDVTTQESTVTISECKTPEGFFRLK